MGWYEVHRETGAGFSSVNERDLQAESTGVTGIRSGEEEKREGAQMGRLQMSSHV